LGRVWHCAALCQSTVICEYPCCFLTGVFSIHMVIGAVLIGVLPAGRAPHARCTRRQRVAEVRGRRGYHDIAPSTAGCSFAQRLWRARRATTWGSAQKVPLLAEQCLRAFSHAARPGWKDAMCPLVGWVSKLTSEPARTLRPPRQTTLRPLSNILCLTK